LIPQTTSQGAVNRRARRFSNPDQATEFPVISRRTTAEVQDAQTFFRNRAELSLAAERMARLSKRSRWTHLNLKSRDNFERGFEMSHVALVWSPSSEGVNKNLIRPLRRAARALLRSLRETRERDARRLIWDYRHLLRN
jgi:hypothetical protein